MFEIDNLSLPTRNLRRGVLFFVATVVVSVLGYMAAGWSFMDALYMVVITVFSVGYREVQPIETDGLRLFTMGVIGVGCIAIIFVSGALVQFLTAAQVGQMLGLRRMTREISKLRGHTIVCGFGRLGRLVTNELKRCRKPFLVLDRSPQRLEEARQLGFLTVSGDATDEKVLLEAGIRHAANLATVLPDDAANVFITLSARNLSPTLRIIARGEVPSTESKLLQAGATHVVLPAHIGAERVAHLLLFPDGESLLDPTQDHTALDGDLAGLGVSLEEMVVPEGSFLVGATVEMLVKRAAGEALLIALHSNQGGSVQHPPEETIVEAGDALVWLVREGHIVTLKDKFFDENL